MQQNITISRVELQNWLDSLETRCGTNAEERGPNGAITQMLRALERADQAGQAETAGSQGGPAPAISLDDAAQVLSCLKNLDRADGDRDFLTGAESVELDSSIVVMKKACAALRGFDEAKQDKDPAQKDGWLQDGSLLYRLTDDRRPCNRDEIRVTMADGSHSPESCTRRAGELLDRIRGI